LFFSGVPFSAFPYQIDKLFSLIIRRISNEVRTAQWVRTGTT